MKIAFLNIYNGLANRGAERTTYELANRLGLKHEVILYQGGAEKTQANYKTVIKRPVINKISDSSLSFFRKFYLDRWSLCILIFTIKIIPDLFRERFDVIVPVNGGWQTLLCKAVTSINKSKMAIIGRAGIGRDDHWNLLCRPDIFVALTSPAYNWAKKISKKSKIIHIPNGIDLDFFDPDGAKADTGLKKPVVMCAAALTKNKNIDLTIRALKSLEKFQLLILGDGPMRLYLEKMAADLLGHGRFLIEKADLRDMPKYYRTAEVFTLVSDSGEAFGNVYLEALAMNLPVVATCDDSRKEIIGNAGFYTDTENPEGYSKLIQKAYDTDFGSKPRDQARKFSWDIIIKQYEEVFTEIKK